MTSRKNLRLTSFENLDRLLKKKPRGKGPVSTGSTPDTGESDTGAAHAGTSGVKKPDPETPPPAFQQTPLSGDALFKEAMKDVAPIHWPHARPTAPRSGTSPGINRAANPEANQDENEDEEIRAELEALVKHGTGYRVSDTDEYVEGGGYRLDPRLKRRLHRGKFAIQGHIDLHGLRAREAEIALAGFIENNLNSGKRCLLIVHGRGLSSPGEPVLKAMVVRFLSRGPYRRRLIAYTSARPRDGGAGATIVLFSKKPIPKTAVRRK